MPTCQKCGFRWSWKITFKKMVTFRINMKCPNCKQDQYLSAKAKKRSIALPFPFLMIGICLQALNIPFFYMLIYYLVMLLAVFCLNPLLAELSNEEEPLW